MGAGPDQGEPVNDVENRDLRRLSKRLFWRPVPGGYYLGGRRILRWATYRRSTGVLCVL